MNRKGQSAMEFLMTYGWAILVVLIAIGALSYFGVLDPQVTDLAQFGPPITNDGIPALEATAQTITVALRNGVGGSIVVDPSTLAISLETGSCSSVNGTINGNSTNQTISQCSNFIVQLVCGGAITDGDKMKGTVSFSYEGTNGVTYEHRGTVQGTWK